MLYGRAGTSATDRRRSQQPIDQSARTRERPSALDIGRFQSVRKQARSQQQGTIPAPDGGRVLPHSSMLHDRRRISSHHAHQKDSSHGPACNETCNEISVINRANRLRCVVAARQRLRILGAPGRIRTCDARLRSPVDQHVRVRISPRWPHSKTQKPENPLRCPPFHCTSHCTPFRGHPWCGADLRPLARDRRPVSDSSAPDDHLHPA
jgi:hypothetical protein